MAAETLIVPNVTFGYEDVHFTTAEIATRQDAISRNSQTYLQAWRAGEVKPGLFDYQEEAFEALLKFTHETGLAVQPSPDELSIPSGYLDEPTSWGKTALMAEYMGAIGIGTLPTPESPMPLRALVGTLAQYAVKQTAGALDVTRGLKKFLPNMDITMCFAEHKELTGNVSVITYRMLLLLVSAGRLKNYYVDVALGDEAHNLLAPQTKKMWLSLTKDKRSIGVTASPEYGPDKKLRQFFDHLVHESTLRAHVEAGNVSAVQVMGFATGSEIAEPAAGTTDFSDTQLEPLMLDAKRNQAICDVTAQMVTEGRRGIINALAGKYKGQTLFHPRLLAKALDGREIEDDFGNKRRIKAAAIGSHISATECEKILAAFKKGEYDVVIQVDKINQSFDFDDVAFVVNAAPTLSPVRAIQRTGRLMRKSDEWPIKTIIEFIDDIRGSRIPYTAWHVLGEREILKQGQVFAPPDLLTFLNDGSRPGKGRSGGGGGKKKYSNVSLPDPDVFSDLLKAMHRDYSLRLVETFTLKAREGYGPPRPNWRELQSIVAEKYNDRSLGYDGIRGLLERAGKAAEKEYCELAQGSRGPTYFVSPEGEKFLSGYEFPQKAPSREWKTERELVEILEITRDMFKRCSEGVARSVYLAHRINREHEHFGPGSIALIKQRLEAIKQQEEEAGKLISAAKLAEEVGWERQSINFFLTSHHGVQGKILKNPGQGPDARFYTDEEADFVRRHRRHSYQVPRGDLKKRKVVDLEVETGRSREDILAAVEALNLAPRVRDGRYKDSDGRFVYSELTTSWTAKQIKKYFEEGQDEPIVPAPSEPEQQPESESKAETMPVAEAAASSPPPPQPVQFRVAGLVGAKTDSMPSEEPTESEAKTRSKPKKVSQPAVVDKSEASAAEPAEEQRLDLIAELKRLDAPCEPGAATRIANSCGIRLNDLIRKGDTIMANQDIVLKMAERISKLYVAPPNMRTADEVAEHLEISAEELATIVAKLSVSTYTMVEVFRKRGPDGKGGPAAVHMNPKLQDLIARAVKRQRSVPRAVTKLALKDREQGAANPDVY